MSCTLSSLLIEFTELGIKIMPYKADLRIDKNKFDHCRTKVSREAGELIADKTSGNPNQPVALWLGEDHDVLLRRMYLPRNSIEYGDEEAWLTLMDPLHVMKDGIIDKSYEDGVTLKDVMEDVFLERNDPNGVIRDWDITSPEFSDEINEHYEEWLDNSLLKVGAEWLNDAGQEGEDLSSVAIDAVSDAPVGLMNGVANLYMDINRDLQTVVPIWEHVGILDFDQISPYQALQKIKDQYEVEIWVDQKRKLWVGKRETDPTIHMATPHPETLTISEYNVTEAAFPVAEVIVKGGKARLVYEDADGEGTDSYAVGNKGINTWGQARVENIENGRTVTVKNKDLQEPQALRQAAERRLIEEMSQNQSGNIVLNPAISGIQKLAHPNAIELGDYIIVVPPPSCSNFDQEGGRFKITSVNHSISGDNGWDTTVSVSHIPEKEINARSFYYKPETGEIVEEDQLYIHGTGDGAYEAYDGYGG